MTNSLRWKLTKTVNSKPVKTRKKSRVIPYSFGGIFVFEYELYSLKLKIALNFVISVVS